VRAGERGAGGEETFEDRVRLDEVHEAVDKDGEEKGQKLRLEEVERVLAPVLDLRRGGGKSRVRETLKLSKAAL